MGPGDQEYIDSLRRLAGDLGVARRFAVLPPVAYDDLGRYTTGAHVGHALYEPIHVNNRYMGTASNKVLEYMAAGLPVLLSSQAGFRQLVDRYGCGLVVDERSPQEVAAAISTLLANPGQAHSLGQAGRQAFMRELNYQVQFAPALEAIQRLAGGSVQ
jgi:glycosyltransferase involved in cell wall biosynthesis